MKSYQIMCFIGNGFDINVLNKYGKGITTSYESFYHFFGYKYPARKDNLLIQQMKEAKKEGKKNWSDFEALLNEILQNIVESDKLKIEQLNKDLNEIQRAFSEFLNDIIDDDVIGKISYASEILRTKDDAITKENYTIYSLSHFLSDLSDEQYNKMHFHNGIDNGDSLKYIFLNLNYTALLDNYLYLDKKIFDPEPYIYSENNFKFMSNPNLLKNHQGYSDPLLKLEPIRYTGTTKTFKTIWAKANIPSQMISMKTAELFARGKAEGNKSKYYLHNIILGILGKTGGIPWIVKDMPGNVDCFVGLDVATIAKGIHYPACSVVFDKYGRLLGFYKPTTPQQGEKITTRILQDIFDQVIFSYEDRFGEMPKNVVIHRDGFSNENDDWYRNYFGAKDIEYSIIEVRKNVSSKLILLQDDNVMNPTMGYCVYNNNKGYLVTTDMKNKKGSPNPILVEKKCGDVSMAHILTQILYLSQLHVGSTHKMRLPITTGYADKICKNRDFVPEGNMDDRLFFL